jgi:hypothetical protein
MSPSTNDPRVPGARLLELAQLLFDDDVVTATIQPTIADLQHEIAAAGASRVASVRARWRGYCAFWIVALFSLFHVRPVISRDGLVRLVVGASALAWLAVVGPVLGMWFAVVTVAGALLAAGIHAWYDRHPSELPAPDDHPVRTPQINFSSTEVAGNIGGLIFVVGSVIILAVALPSALWIVLGSTVAGGFLAWGLFTWRANHPGWGLPSKRFLR